MTTLDDHVVSPDYLERLAHETGQPITINGNRASLIVRAVRYTCLLPRVPEQRGGA